MALKAGYITDINKLNDMQNTVIFLEMGKFLQIQL